MSENPAIQDYIQEHTQWSQMLGLKRRKDVRRKRQDLGYCRWSFHYSVSFNYENQLIASSVEDLTTPDLNTPRYRHHFHVELVGIYRFHRHQQDPAARHWLIWDLLREFRGRGVPRRSYPHRKQRYRNGKDVNAHQPARHHIAPMKRVRCDKAKQRGPQNATHDVLNQLMKMILTKMT
jgi:hypothetical protein